MNKARFEQEYKRLTDHLDECRQVAIEETRKNDLDVIKANSEYSLAITRLDANWATVRRGQYDQEAHINQRQKLLDKRDKVENDAIREGFIKVKEKALDNFFAGEPDRREEASERINTSPSYAWLNEPGREREVAQNLEQEPIRDDFAQGAGTPIPPVLEEFQQQRGEEIDVDAVEIEDNELPVSGDEPLQPGEEEKLLDTDGYPGFANWETPDTDTSAKTIETTLDAESYEYPGYDSVSVADESTQPEKGIKHTPSKDGPTMDD